MKCDICDMEIVYCDDCATNFEKGDTVFCGHQMGREHICADCSYTEGKII